MGKGQGALMWCRNCTLPGVKAVSACVSTCLGVEVPMDCGLVCGGCMFIFVFASCVHH